VFALIGPTVTEPVTGWLPDHPPDAVHEDAFVAVQVSVDDCPVVTVEGVAVRGVVKAGTEIVAPGLPIVAVTVLVAEYTYETPLLIEAYERNVYIPACERFKAPKEASVVCGVLAISEFHVPTLTYAPPL
jgi:hypothetical protein